MVRAVLVSPCRLDTGSGRGGGAGGEVWEGRCRRGGMGGEEVWEGRSVGGKECEREGCVGGKDVWEGRSVGGEEVWE